MHIAIDARSLSHPQPGGFKTYTTHLVQALLKEDRENEYVLYLDRPVDPSGYADFPNVTLEVIRPVGGWAGVPLREQIWLPFHFTRWHPDVVHFPCATGSIAITVPLVVTIHDAIEFFERPRLTRLSRESVRRRLMVQYNRWVQRVIARHATTIITVSTQSMHDIAKTLRVPKDKIRVIPNAHAEFFRPCQEKDKLNELTGRLKIPDKFLLALASASPRKNASGLLRIYGRLPHTLRARYPLVIVWTHSFLQPEIEKEVKKLGLKDSTYFLPRVSDEDLVLLYNAATAFVFPSLYEGFGLPVLEAMACGTPVIASNLSSIPEVAGDAAELANPRDEDAFAEALFRVLTSPDRRRALSEAGLRRARQFSWQRTAQMTLDVYREVASNRTIK